MHFVYADLENIGLSSFKRIVLQSHQQYFVVSKNASVRRYCQQNELDCFSDYPTAKDAADKVLIKKLCKTLNSRNDQQLQQDKFIILTKDKKLIKRFIEHCSSFGMSHVRYKYEETQVYQGDPCSLKMSKMQGGYSTKFERDILNKFKTRYRAYDAWLALPAEYDDYDEFLREFNKLIREHKLVRCAESQKYWIRA